MSRIAAFGRPEVEDLLYHEAALLDAWKLHAWRDLFTAECRYLVPNPSASDPYAPVDSTLYLIADDGHHLTERVNRLGKKTAHSEHPRSRTLRQITNVRILERSAEVLRVRCAFTTWRTASGRTDHYFGHHEHLLIEEAGAVRFVEKRTILETGTLRPQGRLSIIV